MRATKQDEELTLLLTKLYTIQEQVGAKDPTSSSDKRSRAEQAGQQQQLQQSTMGRTRKSKKVGSRFLELKSSIVDHLRTVHTLMEAQNKTKQHIKFSPRVEMTKTLGSFELPLYCTQQHRYWAVYGVSIPSDREVRKRG